MIGGFALVAYPAQYGNSGVMTFLVNHQGTIYEKDLEQTASIAPGMTAFNPDGTWRGCPKPTRPAAQRSEPERAIRSSARRCRPCQEHRVFGG